MEIGRLQYHFSKIDFRVMDYFHIDYAKMRYFCILCASAGFDYAL